MELDDQLELGHLLLENRKCRVCHKDKHLLTDYYLCRKDPTLPSSYSYECKECTVKRTTAYNKRNSSSVKSQYLKRNYGMSFEEFDRMLTDQDNACAVCGTLEPGGKRGRHKRFHVHHDSKTGNVRGLLCGNCNAALKYVKEDIHTLQNMIQYLERRST